ncbi:MAG: TetR family transcriptional regulator [Streptosporangiales bacterium]|nr:TetR family transcriptional regulator [Streptosporangiales bacterium]
MPRIVDHDERRTELAEAVWRVIVRDGVQATSIRTVAREAGRSAGSLRHYFATHDKLLVFAMGLVEDRVRERVSRIDINGLPVDVALRYCVEVLPLDDQRRAEAEVWFALSASGLSAPRLGEIRDRADQGMYELCHGLLEGMRQSGAYRHQRVDEVEVERLWSLLDGLSLHLLFAPRGVPVVDPEAVLRRYFDEVLVIPG